MSPFFVARKEAALIRKLKKYKPTSFMLKNRNMSCPAIILVFIQPFNTLKQCHRKTLELYDWQ